jgi:ribonucleotide reductase alpha subunit
MTSTALKIIEKLSSDSEELYCQIRKNLHPYNDKALLAIASKLMYSFSVPHAREIAGCLYMLVSLRSCPRRVRDYCMAVSHLLSDTLKNFLLRNEHELDEVLAETEFINYTRSYFPAVNMVKSYLMAQSCGDRPRMESVTLMNMRIAGFLFGAFGARKVIQKFREMSAQKYTHASPTLFNAGTLKPQCGSCFLTRIRDELSSIVYRGLGDLAIISKHMGGIGAGLSDIRHSMIGWSGESAGVLSYALSIDRNIGGANQGGRRAGNGTLTLRDWHIDIMDMVAASSSLAPSNARLDNAVTCVWMSNLFLERVKNNGMWTLFCPSHVDDLVSLFLDDFEESYLKFEKLAAVRENEYRALKDELARVCAAHVADPSNDDLRYQYYRLGYEEAYFEKKMLLRHRVIKARDLWDLINATQIRRAAYVMNADKVNACCNMSNIGPVYQPNLCLEIIQPTPNDEISSCNLASLNLKAYCRDVLDWKRTRIDDVRDEDLRRCYDFEDLGNMCRSVVENLNQVIDLNYYPLDVETETTIEKGPISVPNKRNRPLGIGVSGLNDVFAELEIIFSSETASRLNKMIFACMYFNSLIESVKLAIEQGEYTTFRTGTCKVYEAKKWVTKEGSPLSNGLFQFDLWKQYTEYMQDRGRLVTVSSDVFEDESRDPHQPQSDYSTYGILPDEKLYDTNDDEPLDPRTWGQTAVTITTHDTNYFFISVVIEPSWESLREAIMKYGVRNSMLLALMPTASSASVMGNTENTEAHQQLIYTRSVKDGEFLVVVPQLERDLAALGLWNQKMADFIKGCEGSISEIHRFVADFPEYFGELSSEQWERVAFLQRKHRGMFEISQKVILQQARQRGIYVDQSQSLNLYLKLADKDTLSKMLFYSTACLLKTNIYYLRQAPDSTNSKSSLPAAIRNYVATLQSDEEESDQSSNTSTTPQVCTLEEGCLSCSS